MKRSFTIILLALMVIAAMPNSAVAGEPQRTSLRIGEGCRCWHTTCLYVWRCERLVC